MRTQIVVMLALAALTSGCFLTSAPDVNVPRKSEAPVLGVQAVCDAATAQPCGRVTMSLRQDHEDDRWAYWRAGADAVFTNPPAEVSRSGGWDMRVTKYFPLVGCNGGATAADEGLPGARAAFALIPDEQAGFVPTRVAEIAHLPFTDDSYASLEYGGVTLGEEYQNPLVNTIGPGLLKEYSMRDHSVVLSHRVFILRTADGAGFYALRFSGYSRADKTFTFEWRKLL